LSALKKKLPHFSKSYATHHPYLPIRFVIYVFVQTRYGPTNFPRLTLFLYLSIGPTEAMVLLNLQVPNWYYWYLSNLSNSLLYTWRKMQI